jgi:hypothetical protein
MSTTAAAGLRGNTMTACTYIGPEDDYEEQEELEELDDLLHDELLEDGDAWERSNDDGWYFDDED